MTGTFTRKEDADQMAVFGWVMYVKEEEILYERS